MSLAHDQHPYDRNPKPRARKRLCTQWALALAGAVIAGFAAGLHSGWAGGLATGLLVLGSAIQRPRPAQPREPVVLTVSAPPDVPVILIVIVHVGPAAPGSEQERFS
jgi:hypothetical protein